MLYVKKAGVSAVMALVTFNYAASADLPRAPAATGLYKRQDPLPIWQGLYGGLSVGVMGTAVDVKSIGKTPDSTQTGFAPGAFIGYNFASGPWVGGIEADIAARIGSNKKTAVAGLGDLSVTGGALGSLRLRGGYAWNNVLFYGTGGLALANLTVKSSLGGTSKMQAGPAIGVGVEWAFDKDWTARMEAIAYSFKNEKDTLAGFKRDTTLSVTTVRLGLARRF